MIDIIPMKDLKDHKFGKYCDCKPKILNGYIIVHAAFDGREAMEETNEILDNKNLTDKWQIFNHA